MYVLPLQRKANGKVVYPRKEIATQARIRNSYERKLYVNLLKTFGNIGKQISQDLNNGQRNPLSVEAIEPQIGNILVEHYRQLFFEFGERTRNLFKNILKKQTEFEQLIQDYLLVIGGLRITQISDTTRRQIMLIINAGHLDGLGQNAIARQIIEYTEGSFTAYRARMIARTETHQASVFANHKITEEQGIANLQKRWISTNDNRTRSHHRQLNGITIGMEEDFVFTVGINEYRMSHPADPRGGAINNINCRCVLAYVMPEDTIITE